MCAATQTCHGMPASTEKKARTIRSVPPAAADWPWRGQKQLPESCLTLPHPALRCPSGPLPAAAMYLLLPGFLAICFWFYYGLARLREWLGTRRRTPGAARPPAAPSDIQLTTA